MLDINDLNLVKVLDSAHIGIVIHRWDTSIVYANPTALELLRLSFKQIIGKDAKDPQWNFINEAHRRLQIDEYPVNKSKNSPQVLRNEIIGLVDSSSSNITWLMVNAYKEHEPDSEDGFIVVTFNDISREKKQFSFQQLMQNTQDIVIVTEAENINSPLGPEIIYVNAAFEKVTGYKAEEVLGETPRILQGDMTDKNAKHRIREALEKKEPITETVLNYTKAGKPYWLEMNIFPLINAYGDVTHFAAIERDVSEKRFYQQQLEKRNQDLKAIKENLEELVKERTTKLSNLNDKLGQMAFYDQLTEIPNRRYFMEQAERMFSHYLRQDCYLAAGLVDIDNFKSINDKHGHSAGDLVLQCLACAMRKLFRQEDAFCRYGGEEFAFVILIDKDKDLHSLCNRLLTEIRDLKCPVSEQQSISITISLGVCVCKPNHREDAKLESVLNLADRMLYKVKAANKNDVLYTDFLTSL
tara:strand:- start:13283 stop:14689 length:1407 start_codon:yes stop_codon:yes gene_type:complete